MLAHTRGLATRTYTFQCMNTATGTSEHLLMKASRFTHSAVSLVQDTVRQQVYSCHAVHTSQCDQQHLGRSLVQGQSSERQVHLRSTSCQMCSQSASARLSHPSSRSLCDSHPCCYSLMASLRALGKTMSMPPVHMRWLRVCWKATMAPFFATDRCV